MNQVDNRRAQTSNGSHTTENSIDSLPASNAELLLELEGFAIERICQIEERKNEAYPGRLDEQIRYAFTIEVRESGIPPSPDFVHRQHELAPQRDPNWLRSQLSTPEHNCGEDVGSSSIVDRNIPVQSPLVHYPYAQSSPVAKPAALAVSSSSPRAVETSMQSLHTSANEWEDIPLTPETKTSDRVLPATKTGDCRQDIMQGKSNFKESHTNYRSGNTTELDGGLSQPQDCGREEKKKTRTRRLLERLTPSGLRKCSGGEKSNTLLSTVYSVERTPPKRTVPGKENDPEQSVMQMNGTGEDLQCKMDLHETITTEAINFNDEDVSPRARNTWRKSFHKSLRGFKSVSRLRVLDPADEENYFGKRAASGKADSVVDDGYQNSKPCSLHKKASSQTFSIQPTPLSKYGSSMTGTIPCSPSKDQYFDESASLRSFDQGGSTKLPSIPRSSDSESDLQPSSEHQRRKQLRDTSWGRKTQRALGGIVGSYAEDSFDHSSPVKCSQSVNRHVLFRNQKSRTRRVASENKLASMYERGEAAMSQSQAAKSVDNLAMMLDKGLPTLPVDSCQRLETQTGDTQSYQGLEAREQSLFDAEFHTELPSNDQAVVDECLLDSAEDSLSVARAPTQDVASLAYHPLGDVTFEGNLGRKGKFWRSTSESKASASSTEEDIEREEFLPGNGENE